MPIFTFHTNISKDKITLEFLKKISKCLSQALAKAEEKVAVTILSDQVMVMGGSEAVCGQGSLASIGAPNRCINEKVIAEVSELFEKELGIPKSRCVIQFLNPEPQNVGRNGVLVG